MKVEKYRSVEEMPPPWRDPDDPGNLRRIAAMMSVWFRMNPRPEPGVRRFHSVTDANRERRDPYRETPEEER
ncbi:MAG TPA: hypothetical protein VMT00_08045 [Thermoanaerobaculia bacterium]|nr:hypothetical protein [Thermoanaerobaculia bacterium]